jgi:shikimate dehydrogenase
VGKAEVLASEVGAMAAAFDETARAANYDVVVNATTLGQADAGAASPVPAEALRRGQLVMDIVYKPVHTRLVEAAARSGAVAVHGGRMLRSIRRPRSSSSTPVVRRRST